MSNKIDSKPKLIRRDRERHYIRTKGDIVNLNYYAPNIRAPKVIKETAKIPH